MGNTQIVSFSMRVVSLVFCVFSLACGSGKHGNSKGKSKPQKPEVTKSEHVARAGDEADTTKAEPPEQQISPIALPPSTPQTPDIDGAEAAQVAGSGATADALPPKPEKPLERAIAVFSNWLSQKLDPRSGRPVVDPAVAAAESARRTAAVAAALNNHDIQTEYNRQNLLAILDEKANFIKKQSAAIDYISTFKFQFFDDQRMRNPDFRNQLYANALVQFFSDLETVIAPTESQTLSHVTSRMLYFPQVGFLPKSLREGLNLGILPNTYLTLPEVFDVPVRAVYRIMEDALTNHDVNRQTTLYAIAGALTYESPAQVSIARKYGFKPVSFADMLVYSSQYFHNLNRRARVPASTPWLEVIKRNLPKAQVILNVANNGLVTLALVKLSPMRNQSYLDFSNKMLSNKWQLSFNDLKDQDIKRLINNMRVATLYLTAVERLAPSTSIVPTLPTVAGFSNNIEVALNNLEYYNQKDLYLTVANQSRFVTDMPSAWALQNRFKQYVQNLKRLRRAFPTQD